MDNKLTCRVAFVGAGYMTCEHIKAFKDIPEVELVGICSRTKLRAEHLAKEVGINIVSNSIADLYERTRADLLVIAVPELSMRDVCLEAFKYPWTCLIEKPAGYNFIDAQIISDHADSLNCRAYVALNRRHYSSTKIVIDDISSQEGIRLIQIHDQEDQIAARNSGQPELVVDNWMFANSIHMIDFFNILGRGKITSVTPIVKWNPGNPNFVVAKITYDSGDIGIYEAIWNGPGPWSASVSTQISRWEMRPLEQATLQQYGSRKLEPQPTHEWDTKFKPGLRAQASEAVKSALGQTSKLPSISDALKSMELVQAIYGDGFECIK